MSRLAFLVVVALSACRAQEAPAPAPVPLDEVARPAEKPPACVHERCAERPKWLRCVERVVVPPDATCMKFEIDYEHHCECDAWEATR